MRTRSSRRRLPFFTALFPYLGGKRRLCPLIFREIDRLLPRRHWHGRTFLDGFLGGGSVSLYAKAQGFRVVATDIAERAITVGQALIENSRVRLTREDVLRLLEPSDASAGRIERELVPAVFTANLGRFLDRALAVADESADPAKAALIRMLAIRLALLEHPMSQVRKGTIHRVSTGEYEAITDSCVHHYVEGLRLTTVDRVWHVAQQINAGVFQGEGRVLNQSVLDVLPTIEADVAYFDPPYPAVMSYEREYKVIDQILEGRQRETSPFTARDGAAMIDGLFERAGRIPIWLLSLGNEVVTLNELEEKMRRLGRATRAFEIKHQHLPAIATDEKKERNREFLVVGWEPETAFLGECSAIGADAQDQVVVPDDLGVAFELESHGGRAEAPTLARGLRDAADQLQPGVAHESGSLAPADPVSELEHGVDLPHAVFGERSIDGDAEVGSVGPVAHAHRLARNATRVKENSR